MKAPRFKSWFSRVPTLNGPQRRQVLDALHPAAGLDQVVALIAEARGPGRCCPRCGGARCHRHGFANDLQRFRCCDCGRTFNDLSGTPLARLRHKVKWLAYSQLLLDSLSVRKAADRTGVHRNTAFRWRHRFLDWVKLDRPAGLPEWHCRGRRDVPARIAKRIPHARPATAPAGRVRCLAGHFAASGLHTGRARSQRQHDHRGHWARGIDGGATQTRLAGPARSAGAAGHRQPCRLSRLFTQAPDCAPDGQSAFRGAHQVYGQSRHPRAERECVSRAFQGLASGVSRRGVALSA